MTSSLLIYGLIDPETQQLRYIGRSTQGMLRPKKHLMPSQRKSKTNPHKASWLNKLAINGLKPEIVVFEYCSDFHSLMDAEDFYISSYKVLGVNLLNSAKGGANGPLGVKYSDETKAKIGAASRLFYSRAEIRLSQSRKNGGTSILCSNGIIYYTVSEAARQLEVSKPNITAVLLGRRKSAGGYTFKRVNDDGTEIKQD